MKKTWRWPFAGFITGGLVGVALLTINVVGVASGGPGMVRSQAADRALDVLHTPPVLVSNDEPTALTYDTVCPPTGEEPAAPCSPTGTLHVRAVGDRGFAAVPLSRGADGLFSYTVPERLKNGAGFEYYVMFQDGRGNGVTVPAGGAATPEHAWVVSKWTTANLGTHEFDATRAPGSVVVTSGWGATANDLGLNQGQEQSRIGPSGFDVEPDGTVIVLDQVNHRLAQYRAGSVAHVPIVFQGGEGDVAVDSNGTAWVLDDGGSRGPVPVVRAYDASGRPVTQTSLAAQIGDMLRAAPNGPVVHSYPSEMWLPVGSGQSGRSPEEQLRGARVGRPVVGGRELVVSASPHEARFGLVAGNKVVSAWRVTSTTNLGEVQLAEPSGSGLTAVVRVWTEDRAEFRVLQLAQSGLTGSFTVTPAEWAESAPLSRFRLRGGTLYQLRSSPAGAEIVTYLMGGAR
jgi:hypothetical protein